jgi:ADP-heptose:LPS heptosyltransferase
VAADPEEAGALMAALDATVAVCSAAVHLGGALGARVIALVPAHPEWRYLEAGDRLPWYPSVEVVRQARPGDWGPVLEQVAKRL